MDRRYIIQRLSLMVFSIYMVITILFFLFRQVPGGVTAMMAPGTLPRNVRQRIIEDYGLHQPLWKQYLLYMYNFIQGDLGQSFYYGTAVADMIALRFINTLSLMLTAIVFSYIIGVYIGAHLGWMRGKSKERLGMLIVLIARSTPVFFTALVMLYVFSFELGWFPYGAMRSVAAGETGIARFLSVDFLYHLVLPVVSLSIFYTGLPLLLLRNNMLEVVTEDYIETARAKGLEENRIVFRHAARNAILPVVTAFAVAIGFSVGGQVLIETVFSWPGLGREMVNSALRNDYPMAQATFLTLAVMVILMNFIADMLYSYLDPRVRVGNAEGGP